MLTSHELRERAGYAGAVTSHALKMLTLSTTPYYNGNMQLKMLSTSAYHLVRSLKNMACAIQSIGTALFNLKDGTNNFKGDATAAGVHFLAGLVDLLNVFATLISTIIRSCVTLKSGYIANGKGTSSNEAPSRNLREEASQANSFFKIASELAFTKEGARCGRSNHDRGNSY
jgi:hypothetical protein